MSYKTLLLLLACALGAAQPAAAKEIISTKIAAETKINPLLILSTRTFGSCAHLAPGAKPRPAADTFHQRCMELPVALAALLKARGFDVVLASFDPDEQMADDAYWTASAAWVKEQQRAHQDRYVLKYDGLREDLSSSILLMSLYAPGGETRERLGSVNLQRMHWQSVRYAGMSPSTILRPLQDVVNILANTMDARCASMGKFKGCGDRATLTEIVK